MIGHLTTGPDGWLKYEKMNFARALESMPGPFDYWVLDEEDGWQVVSTNFGSGTYVSTTVRDIQ